MSYEIKGADGELLARCADRMSAVLALRERGLSTHAAVMALDVADGIRPDGIDGVTVERSENLTSDEALDALRAGERLRLTVGPHPDDPVLLVWQDDGVIASEAIGGWSAGVREVVCAAASEYLVGYLSDRHGLIIDTEERA
jgi:hypothetical protein